jgi:glycosyltransferase involved in cell wall biosynthesis
MNSNRKISVCMATYNGSRFIRKQIDSILSQLSENDELIISDDNSTDDTREIIYSIGDSRVKLLIHNKLPPPNLHNYSVNYSYLIRYVVAILLLLPILKIR